METRRAAPDLDTAVTYREVLDRIEGLSSGEGKSAA